MLLRLTLALLLLASPLYATTYYLSPSGADGGSGLTNCGNAWKTFNKAFTTMAAGDTLNLCDGTYSVAAGTGAIEPNGTNSNTPPSGISVAQPTIIQAINPGAVKVVGYAADGYSGTPLRLGGAAVTKSYIVIDGITFDNDEAGWVGGSAGWLYKASYVTIKNCGFLGNFSLGTNDHDIANDYNLIQDVWIVANENRVIASNYRANKNTWRRVIIRGDGCGTASCTGSGNPNVGFTVYESADVSLQNVIILDRILASSPNVDEPYADFSTAQHTAGSRYMARDEWLGTVSLKAPDGGYVFEAENAESGPTTWTVTNAIAWDTSGTSFNHVTHKGVLTNLTAHNNCGAGVCDGVRVAPDDGATGSVTNIEVARAGRIGINSKILPTYCNVFGAQNAYGQTTCVTGATTADALTNGSLLHFLRIEDGSSLDGTGLGGADKGANIVKRYGVDGTRFGDAFYNTLTDVNLWPWPNQTRIKQEMCTDLGITRGFCAGGLTLTGYIWNYLGNGSPYEGAQTVTVQTQVLPDLLVGQSCNDTFTATGGNGSAFAWTLDSGTLPNGCTLSSSGNLTGTTTTEGTFNFTLEACDDESPTPNCDTEAFTKNISDPPPMDAFFNVGSNALTVRFGLAGLEQSQSCTATLLYNAQTVDTETASTGFASRSLSFSGLTPGQQYCVDVACGAVAVADRYCPTMLAQSSGNQAVALTFGTPFSGLTGAARLLVEYDDNEALSTPATGQDVNFGDGIRVDLSIPAGLYWWRWKWQTAADAVLATSAVQTLTIP